jgi:transcriptional regulator with XRE-family HTH domain
MKRLKEIREEQGLSIRELATLSGVAPSTISQVEQGKRKPHLTTKDALATALNASRANLAGELEGRTEEEYDLLMKLVPPLRGADYHIEQLGPEFKDLKSLFADFYNEFNERVVDAVLLNDERRYGELSWTGDEERTREINEPRKREREGKQAASG